MMTIVIMFKNGKELRMKCEGFNIKRSIGGELTGWEYKGAKENAITWMNMDEVLCIYRVISNEVREEAHENDHS